MTFASTMSYEASYVKARKKAVKQLKNSNAQQLEIETKKMEERIRALKEQMFREKEEREKQGGTRWASGKSGPLNSHAQDVLTKKSLKAEKAPRKIKVLGDEPLQSYRKKVVTPRVQQGDNFGASGCGQCERMKATLVCIECAEKYCVSCFMSFHQKGALKKHSTQTLDEYEAEQIMEKESYKKSDTLSSTNTPRSTNHDQGRASQISDSTKQHGGALLQGSYDEQESAQSFAEALMAWRNSAKEEKMWSNPTDTESSSRDTSTTPEPSKYQEVKLNFGPNKSLSYLDRMLLKKHHSDPAFTSPETSPKSAKPEGTGMAPNKNDAFESSNIEDQLGTNYREIFQSLGSSNRNSSHENVTSCNSAISIEEVNDDDLNGEETTACIVEEEDDSHPHSQGRPVSRSGGVSIMCMTPMGRFEADTDALVLEDVSPVSVNSPGSEQGAPFSRLGVRGANSRASQDQTGGWTGRIWSPQPRHVGLSEFFLAGVQGESPLGRVSHERDAMFDPTSVKLDKLSKSLLSQNVWKPHDSIFASGHSTNRHEQQQQQQQQQGEDSASEGRKESPRPIIPFLCEPGLSDNDVDRPHSQSSTIVTPVLNDSQFIHDTQIHDFGIVDFLKAQPYMPKGYEEYSQVHRVSTVSPLTLSPNPPSFHWSDDSDDDFLAHICTNGVQEDQRADQDEDDRATLTDLAWELASTTGRLTQCELDDDEGEGEEEFEDSIETNDFGSGLSSSEEDINATDTYSASISRIKEKEENMLAEEEVHALK